MVPCLDPMLPHHLEKNSPWLLTLPRRLSNIASASSQRIRNVFLLKMIDYSSFHLSEKT